MGGLADDDHSPGVMHPVLEVWIIVHRHARGGQRQLSELA